MARLHRDTVSYWLFAIAAAAFSLLCVWIFALLLSMSMTGRIQGGTSLNLIVAIGGLLWAWTLGAFDVAYWKARLLPADTSLISLGRRGCPEDPLMADAWRWVRAAWVGWLSFAGLMLATVLIVWVFDPWSAAVR